MTTSEQRYAALRKRLDQLGFQQPLGMESLPLVQRLLADLVRTTTSLKNARNNGKNGVSHSNGAGDASSCATITTHYGTKPGHFETSKIHFPTCEGVSEVSERANE